MRLAALLSEPIFECLGCYEEFPVSKMFTVNCTESHRFCFEDARRHVEGALRDGNDDPDSAPPTTML